MSTPEQKKVAVDICMCEYVTDKGHRVAVSLVMGSLIISVNHLACAESACYKSTNSCSLQASSFYPGKRCILSSL